jgi:PilZ domain-containing protein
MATHPSTSRATERRIARRFSFDAPLEIEWGSSKLAARVSQISTVGMFVELDQPLWVGARFEARLGVQPPLLLQCTVRRVAPGQGMGVSFEVAESASVDRLEKLVATLRPG